jgi:hypothetical protein
MQPFLRHAGREYYAITLERPRAFALPFAAKPYPILIWDNRGGWSEDERSGLLQAVLDTDSRYAVCGGISCEQWHDDLDQVFIMRYLDDESARDNHFLMTTWHTDQSPEEVAFYFAHSTDSEQDDFKRFLVLYVGADISLARRLEAALTLAVRDPERFIDEHPEPAG